MTPEWDADQVVFINGAWTYYPMLEGSGCPYMTPNIGPPRMGGPERGVSKCCLPAGHDGLHK